MTRIVSPSGETQVTTDARRDQRPSVTVMKDGGWVVTWMSYTQDSTGAEIHQQRFDAKGQAVGQALQVNTNANGLQIEAVVAALPDGGWVVSWASNPDGAGYDIYQQRYDVFGQEIGPERRVNTVTAGGQNDPTITILADGGWVITWRGDSSNGTWDVYQRRYDSQGYEIGNAEQVINSYTGDEQYNPDVTALKDGGWVVTWTSNPQDGAGGGIYQQPYSASGVAVREEVRVNTVTIGEQWQPSVTALADGGWVVTWASRAQDGTGYNIHQQRYHSSGWTVGKETLVNANTVGEQLLPDVTAMPDGGWLVTWVGLAPDGVDNDIYQRRYSASGQALSEQDILVNTTTSGFQNLPSVSVLPDGGWVVTWQSQVGAATFNQIYQQRFTADGVKVGPTTPTALTFAAKAVAEGASTTISAGTLSTDAFVADHAFTYRLVDDAGGRFRLEGNQIKVKDGVRLDYEQARSHVVTIEVRDAAGATLTKSFTIAVGDVASEKLTGSSAADVIKGGMSKDIFNGAGGNDKLWGGLGNDVLTGGSGRDVFVFDTKPNTSTNKDTITDFNVRDDGIWLDNAVFSKLGSGTEARPVQLKSSYFVKGSAAKDANDYVIYDAAKGVLLYDADGSGRGKAVEIATPAKNLAMTNKDFFVI